MRTLEEKAAQENQENIETTYQKVQNQDTTTSDEDESEIISPEPTMSETSGMQAKFAQEIKFGLASPKSLL